jgi:hypothetical protein
LTKADDLFVRLSGVAAFMVPGLAEGWFDERFFLYYEDEDMCLRLLQAGKPVIVQPAVRVAHSNRGSVRGPRPLRVEYGRGYHHARSKVLFTAKHQGPQAAAAHRLPSGRRPLLHLIRPPGKRPNKAVAMHMARSPTPPALCSG